MRIVVMLACAFALAAQDSRFGVDTRLVLVPVTVTDLKGRIVDGLEPSDFRLFDNRKLQKATVDTIDTGVAPISLMIAVQSSGISAPAIDSVRKIGAMIQPMITGERGCAGLITFDLKVAVAQECTKDADLLAQAFRKLRPLQQPGDDKQGHMLDAADLAIRHLSGRPGRRVLLLISESKDRGSETSLESVTVAAQTAGVTVYAFTYSAIRAALVSKVPIGAPRRPIKPKTPNDELGTYTGAPPTKGSMRKPPPEQQVDMIATIGELVRLTESNTTEVLTKLTGGDTFSFTQLKALEEAVGKLGAELHTQYVISFAPESPAPGFHELLVRVVKPGEYRIRARPGYWPEAPK